MCRRASLTTVTAFLALSVCRVGWAQTATYHLHKETSGLSPAWQLKTVGPDAAATAIQSISMKNRNPTVLVVQYFETQTGVPNGAGIIVSGSTVTFTLWEKKSANRGTFFPQARLFLNASAGPSLCTATGGAALTTTLTKYVISCTLATDVGVTATDRLYLQAGANMTVGPGNHNVTVQLSIEGTLNGNYDSLVVAPLPQAPSITSLSQPSGPAGTPVTITGARFGATQGSSTVKFNGTTATATSWSNTSIATTVPIGATTGPVVVTVRLSVASRPAD